MPTSTPETFEVKFAGTTLLFHAPDPDDHIQRMLREEHRVYEEGLLTDCFGRDLPNGLIIDVGANIGNHTIVFAKAMGRRVIAIEPYPRAFEILKKNVELNQVEDLVRLAPAAAGRARGQAIVCEPPAGNWGRASIVADSSGAIEVLPIDELGIHERVALLKIDVEGMESDVLEGAKQLITRFNPLIYVECRTRPDYAVVARQLRRLGYRAVRRFNYTPTYLFTLCRSHRDRITILLDKADQLDLLDDVVAGQREIVRILTRDGTMWEEIFANRLRESLAEPAAALPASMVREVRDALRPLADELCSLRREIHEYRRTLGEMQAAQSSCKDRLLEFIEQSRTMLGEHVTKAVADAVSKFAQAPGSCAASVAGTPAPDRQQESIQQSDVRATDRDEAATPHSPVNAVDTNGQLDKSKRRRRPRAERGSVAVALPCAGTLLEVKLPSCTGAVRRQLAHERFGTNAPPNGSSRQTSRTAPATALPLRRENRAQARDCVSVIMTTHNSAQFVERSVRNVLEQSHANLELIVVDDASEDQTWSILTRLAAEDGRVRPVKMFANRGTYWCKNYGLTLARGKYVTFQDSDDCSDPDRLTLQLRELRNTRAIVCSCNYVRVDHRGAVVPNRGLTERKAIMALMFDREEVLRRAGYFDSVRTSADDEFSRRLGIVLGHERICHIDKPLYRATVRRDSLTNNNRTGAALDRRESAPSDKSFLSVPRREYVRQYSAWHQRIKANRASPQMSFPLLRRPFPAPSLLLPRPQQRDAYVTVSLASMPSRAALLKRTVESILPQADVLNVYLNGYDSTPAWLNAEKIHVIHSSEHGDLRDNGKFFFLDALLHGYHFTIDDDILYPSDYIQKCILKIEQYERRAIIGVHGVILANPFVRYMEGRTVFHFKAGLDRDRFVDLLGTGTTAYHADALKLSLSDFPTPGMADVWLAIAAKRQQIPMVAIQRPSQWLKPMAEAEDDSLYTAARRDDAVQTLAIRKEGEWALAKRCQQMPLCRELAARFSQDELASRGVDVDLLASWDDAAKPQPNLLYA